MPTTQVHQDFSSLFGQSPHKYLGKGGSIRNNTLTAFGQRLLHTNIFLERFLASSSGILQTLPSELSV